MIYVSFININIIFERLSNEARKTTIKRVLFYITAGAAANVAGNTFSGNSVVGYGNFGGASECC
jgi:hypothetical protein